MLMQDDGSRDGTLALLKSQAEADSRFLLTADASPARLRGAIGNFWSLLGQSRGDYTALCDQDDVWHADRLQAGLAAMGEAEARWGRETPLLVHSDARVVDGLRPGCCTRASLPIRGGTSGRWSFPGCWCRTMLPAARCS